MPFPIKSKPNYCLLAADWTGRHHILIGQGAGSEAMLRAARQLVAAAAPVEIHFNSDQADTALIDELKGLSKASSITSVTIYPHARAVLSHLAEILDTARMGSRFYVAGSEAFLWDVTRIAARFGVDPIVIQREATGKDGRNVYCIHCKTTLTNVTTNIVQCPHCHRHLLVRDHFSRFRNAYMGVCADAEVPGERPPVEEIAR